MKATSSTRCVRVTSPRSPCSTSRTLALDSLLVRHLISMKNTVMPKMKVRRLATGETARSLAKRARVPASVISAAENGHLVNLWLPQRLRLASCLGIAPDNLLEPVTLTVAETGGAQ
jgi:hypothetical protein